MKFQIYKDKAGEWRWRLLASNGNIVADSGEGYQQKAACETAVRNIKVAGSAASVEVLDDEGEGD